MPGAPSSAGWDVPARANYLAPFGYPIATALICGRTSELPFGGRREPCYIYAALCLWLCGWCIPI